MSKITGKVNYKSVLRGDRGYTYKPHVTTDGVLYWSNDGNLPNPLPVNIKGKNGDIVQEEEINNLKKAMTLKDLLSNFDTYNFKNNEKVQTMGRETVNDGGSAIYSVVDENIEADGCFIIDIPNSNFKLRLVYSNEIDCRVLGFKDSCINNEIIDNTPILKKVNNYIENNYINITIKFPSGWFGFKEGANWIRRSKMGCHLKGLSPIGEMFRKGLNDINSSIGTVFFPIDENQNYILKFGGNISPTTYSNLEYVNLNNISFWGGTCSIVNGKFTVDRFGVGCKEMLVFDYCSFCSYDNITFTGGGGVINALKVIGFEHFVGNLIFRDIGTLGNFNSCIKFENGTKTNYEVSPSGIIINAISMENCCGSVVDLKNCVDISIGQISVEITNLRNIYDDNNNLNHLSLIKANSIFGAININSLTAQHLGKYTYGNYIYDTILHIYNDYGYSTGLSFNNINIQGCGDQIYAISYKTKNIDSSNGITKTEPCFTFNSILSDAKSVIWDIPSGVRINKKILQSTYEKECVINNILFNKLTPLNSKYLSRITYDSLRDVYFSTPLIYNIDDNDPNIIKKHINPTYLFYSDVEQYINSDEIKGTILLSKFGDSLKTCRVRIIYYDNTESYCDIPKTTTKKLEYINFKININKTKLIKSLIVEQIEPRIKNEYEYIHFYELNLYV